MIDIDKKMSSKNSKMKNAEVPASQSLRIRDTTEDLRKMSSDTQGLVEEVGYWEKD